jgi:hypothetical protein
MVSRTALVLKCTSHYFERLQRESPPRQPTSLKSVPIDFSSKPRRTFGLAPWHRKNSHESFLSVSSSVHKLLIGKTPAATPEQSEEVKHRDQRGGKYPKGMEKVVYGRGQCLEQRILADFAI